MTGLQFKTMKARITRIEKTLILLLGPIIEQEKEFTSEYDKEILKLYTELKDLHVEGKTDAST